LPLMRRSEVSAVIAYRAGARAAAPIGCMPLSARSLQAQHSVAQLSACC
jgi:hypothetical protein